MLVAKLVDFGCLRIIICAMAGVSRLYTHLDVDLWNDSTASERLAPGIYDSEAQQEHMVHFNQRYSQSGWDSQYSLSSPYYGGALTRLLLILPIQAVIAILVRNNAQRGRLQ